MNPMSRFAYRSLPTPSAIWGALSRILFVFPALFLLILGGNLVPSVHAQNSDLVATPVDPGNRVILAGHHPAWASAQNDLGVVPADLPLGHLEFVLSRPSQQQQGYDQYLEELQNPASPNYHHWLTPKELGQRFGASQHDLDAITNWLQSQNLRVVSVANSRVRIQFGGTASSVGNAFGAEIHYYRVEGEQRLSIATDPQIPASLAGIIKSVSGLSTVKISPLHVSGVFQVPAGTIGGGVPGGIEPAATISGSHFTFPSDFATIYDLPGGSVTGAGQTIAVIGRSRVYSQDITNFQTLAGLTPQAPTVIIPPNGVDPGPPETSPPTSGGASPDQAEATLDVSRTASIAPGATIDLVVSTTSDGMDGTVIASEYVVDTDPVFAQIMTISFGSCEESSGSSGDDFWDNIFSQASMEGISVFVASGDAGAAGCDAYNSTPPASQILSINSICASSHATCVGGTEFADFANPAQYWSSTNGTNFESALSYIPEGGWNEPGTGSEPEASASGGGVSVYIPTPVWQVGTGVPGTQGRYTPDVAFSASGHDAYFGCFAAGGGNCVVQNGGFGFVFFSGTSAAAPDMAGITALLNQNAGAAQGELNSNLYRLAGTPSNNVFHDATVATSGVSGCVVTAPSMCNNSTPSSTSQTGGLSGYLLGTGYDEVTGWGSINVAKLLANWGTSLAASTTTVGASQNPILVGASFTLTATVTSTSGGTPTGTVAFLENGSLLGSSALNGSAVATLATSSLAAGTQTITARYSGDSNFADCTSNSLSEQVNNPVPTLTTLGTTSATTGSAGFNLTVTGTNFVSSSVVNFNGSALITQYQGNSTTLIATIPTPDLATAGTFPVTVANPLPGGGTSGSKTFTVNNLAPTLGSLVPSSGTAGGPAFTMTVNGAGFVSTSTMKFNGTAEPTTFVSPAQVTASIPATAIAASGTFPVTVTSPAPGGGTSSSLNFTVSAGVLSVTLATLPTGVATVVYPSTTLTATSGVSPYTWTPTPVSGSLPAGLSFSAAGLITGTPTTAGNYPFTVKVTDSASNTATGAFSITVDAALKVTLSTLPTGVATALYTSTTLGATGGISPYTWTTTPVSGSLPPGLSLSAAGMISGTPTTAGTYPFTVKVTDSASDAATGAFSITVNSGLTVTTASLPTGVANAAYSTTLSVAGGVSPYTWTTTPVSGSFPAGLSLSTAGVLSGTPTTPGTYPFTVKVTDSASTTATGALTITINGPLTVTLATLPTAVATVAYTSTTLGATGGISPYTWTTTPVSGSLPPGLNFSAAGVISGTPTTAGPYPFTLKVTDSAGDTTTGAFTISVNPALKVTLATLPAGVVSALYTSTTLAATGGISPYTWTTTAGSLPTGLNLSTAGVISGTPTASGPFGFTVKVTDSLGATSTASFSITINSPLSITTTGALPSVDAGVIYSVTLAATGGTPPYAWSVSSGSLPGGLSLAPGTGIISGTPTAAGIGTNPTFTVKTTDASNDVATSNLSIAIGGVTFATTTPITVAQGSSTTGMVVLNAVNGFNGTAILSTSISGPSGAVDLPVVTVTTSNVINFNSATTSSTTINVATTAATSALYRPPANFPFRGNGPCMVAAAFLGAFFFVLLGVPAQKRWGFAPLAVLLFVIVAAGVGCTSAGNANLGGNSGTTRGTYTITVTATPAPGGAQAAQTTTITLTVM